MNNDARNKVEDEVGKEERKKTKAQETSTTEGRRV